MSYYQNNYVGISNTINNAAKNFNILAASLSFQQNYYMLVSRKVLYHFAIVNKITELITENRQILVSIIFYSNTVLVFNNFLFKYKLTLQKNNKKQKIVYFLLIEFFQNFFRIFLVQYFFMLVKIVTNIYTHTHIYIYIYIYKMHY